MKRKITINKNANKSISGRLTIPLEVLKELGITESDREVIIKLDCNKLIIEKVENKNIDLVEKICVEITDDEREFLLN